MVHSLQGIQKTINSTQRDADLFIDNAVFFFRKIQGNGLCPNIHEYFFRLILDEAIQNSIHHGNAGDPCKTIYITITPSSQFITITVRDEGKGFSPQEVSDPRSPDNITRPGGRGIHLIKNFGRACWNNEGNEITIILEEGTAADAN